MNLIAYLRVSTSEQGDSGLGLKAQRRAINAYAGAHDHAITASYEDVCSGKEPMHERSGGSAALGSLAGALPLGQGLIVAKLDRASRSVIDGAGILEMARRQRWEVIALDVGMDTTTATGEMMANLMLVLAQWERRLIGERTSAALQELKAQGVRLGRPSTVTPIVRRHITRLRARGLSQEGIADWLNSHNYRTAAGAAWRQKTVGRALRSIALDQEVAK
jgi:DNA invertase Pin-like site-specific DNA recombinase